MMKKFAVIGIVIVLVSVLLGTQSTVTYSTKTQLGDGIFYTFTWTNAATTDSAYVLGRDANGFLVTNMNDKQVTVEISSTEATADSVDWDIDLIGNHAASSTMSQWKVIAQDSIKDARENYANFTTAQLKNYPYIGFLFRGLSGSGNENAKSQTITCRVYFDFDNQYVGKE
jgi:hypothetical protein